MKNIVHDDVLDTRPLLRLLLKALLDYTLKLFVDRDRNRVLLVENLRLQLIDITRIIGKLQSTELIEDHADRINIRPLGAGLVLPKLRCQIIRRTNLLRWFFFTKGFILTDLFKRLVEEVVGFRFDSASSTKITKFGRIVLRQEDVQTLDVSMNDVFAVQILNA